MKKKRKKEKTKKVDKTWVFIYYNVLQKKVHKKKERFFSPRMAVFLCNPIDFSKQSNCHFPTLILIPLLLSRF